LKYFFQNIAVAHCTSVALTKELGLDLVVGIGEFLTAGSAHGLGKATFGRLERWWWAAV